MKFKIPHLFKHGFCIAIEKFFCDHPVSSLRTIVVGVLINCETKATYCDKCNNIISISKPDCR